MWIILWARLGKADRKNIHTNYAKEIDFSFILLKHVNETPTVSKAKIDWADFAGFQEAEDVSHSPQWWVFSIIFLFFFFLYFLFYWKPQSGLFLTQFNSSEAVACGSHLF